MKKIITVLALIAVMLSVTACGTKAEPEAEVKETNVKSAEITINHSIYSWDRELFDENPADVLSKISDYEVSRIYQGLYPSDLKEPEATAQMVKALTEQGVEVIYLTGDPDWDDSAVVEEWTIDLLTAYNESVDKEAQMHTICYDSEFFAHDGWDNETHFKEYTEMMKQVIDYAHQKGFKVILCAPYWLTDFSSEVYADLIASTDELSCTVYLVGQEKEMMAEVYKLCQDAGTQFEIVLETQPVSEEYEVSEYNTYWCNGGKAAVLKTIAELQEEYPDISIGLHSLKYLLELQ